MPELYDRIGGGYRIFRRADPRIAAAIFDALGDAATIVNVGAGAGSYEPSDRFVVAVEPSATMIAQRPRASAIAIRGSAMALPFRDRVFDAAMAILTVHHWPDYQRGIAEMKRVARRRCVILTWEPPQDDFWLVDYLPHFLATDRALFAPWFRDDPDTIEIRAIAVPHDCRDGFLLAYWRRPEAYLDPDVRAAISTFDRVGGFEEGLARLRRDLADGSWHRRNQRLLAQQSLDLGYRLVILGVH